MNGKARDAVGRIAVCIGHNIADRLVEHIAMQRIPDRLVHDAKIFGVEAEGILPGGQIEDEEQAKGNHSKRDQRGSDPEQARTRHWLRRRIQIKPIAQDREAFAPRCTNHVQRLLPHRWAMARQTVCCQSRSSSQYYLRAADQAVPAG